MLQYIMSRFTVAPLTADNPPRIIPPSLLDSLKRQLSNSSWGLLLEYIDHSCLYGVEHDFGTGILDQSVKHSCKTLLSNIIPQMPAGFLYLDKLQLINEDLVLFFILQYPPAIQDLYDLDAGIRVKLTKSLEQHFPMIPPANLNIRTGHCLVRPGKTDNLEQVLINGLKTALKSAKSQEKHLTSSLMAQFEDILNEEKISHLYQPVVSLQHGFIKGWEALARGPVSSYFHSPAILFSYAQETGSLQMLEQLSLKKALAGSGKLQPQQKIFVNINAHSLSSFSSPYLAEISQTNGLSARNIVFEITERTSIQDFNNFKKKLAILRKKGFSIAIDDAGAGYSSLQAIAELQPDYIKLDMSLIHGIDKDPVKEALVETFVTFAKRINAILIAEGIETKEELLTLINLGVHLGQGYYLGRPRQQQTELNRSHIQLIRKFKQKSEEKLPHNTIPLGSIVQACPVISPENTVETVMKFFQEHQNLEGLVVATGLTPLGLVMRHQLFTSLSCRYGVALYYRKSICAVMDAHPLIIEEDTSLEKASQLATARDSAHLYDHIIVTGNGVLQGIVSIRHLLEVITQSKIRMAQYANPLTGLPGNIRIQEEIIKIIQDKQEWHITYADIDGFKKYNDTYGFERGDVLLLKFSAILKHANRKHSGEESFLGHIGGDDFILITPPARTDKINTSIVRLCQRIFQDQVTASLATIRVYPGRFTNHLEVAENAAQAKREAKSREGCIYIKEHDSTNGPCYTCIFPS